LIRPSAAINAINDTTNDTPTTPSTFYHAYSYLPHQQRMHHPTPPNSNTHFINKTTSKTQLDLLLIFSSNI